MKSQKLLFLFLIFLFSSVFTMNVYSQWTFVGFVTGAGTFPSISVVDANTAFIGGGPNGVPVVFRTTNGGTNWTPISTTGITLELYCIWANNVNTIFVGDGGASGGAGGNAKVYRTTNGGTSWTNILSTGGSAGFINGIVFSRSNPNFGIAQSDPPSGAGQTYWIAKSTDAGANWTVTNPPGISGAASAQNSVVVIDNLFYGFGLNAGSSRIDLTTDGGTSWNARTLGVTGSFISGFAFSSDKMTGIAASNTSLPNISRSVNGGTSFSSLNTGSGVTGYCTMKWVPGTNVCYYTGATGGGGVVKKSTDGGATWTQMTTSGITGLTHMELVLIGNTVYAYAVAGDGSVIKLVDNLVGLDPSNTQTPTKFVLQQNYPNPFNPSTNIKFSVPSNSQVTIKIYNNIGKEVKTVMNKELAAGNYIETVDMSDFSSGVYFYTLQAGDFKETKKMMLVK